MWPTPSCAHGREDGFEECVGASAVVRRAHDLGLHTMRSPRAVFTAARRGDIAALEVVAEEAKQIALAIATIAPVLNPELVVFGGGIAGNGDLLLGPIASEVERLSPFRPRLAISGIGEEAVLLGAVATSLEAAQDTVFTRAQGEVVL